MIGSKVTDVFFCQWFIRNVSKKQVFLVLVLFSAHAERIVVSCMRDFSDVIPKFTLYYIVGNYNMILNGTLQEKKAILKQWQDSLKKIDGFNYELLIPR